MNYRVSITIDRKRYTLTMFAKSTAHALKIIAKQAKKYAIESRISRLIISEKSK